MYFPDMGTTTQVIDGPQIRAVGWLDALHPFSTGSVEAPVLDRIRVFAKAWGASGQALGWGAFAGPHTCDLCGAFRASGNFGVPHGDVLFVCPEMIVHYVAEHGYCPPPAFVAAITDAALPGSEAYAIAAAPFHRRAAP